jgi:hypothetical protein
VNTMWQLIAKIQISVLSLPLRSMDRYYLSCVFCWFFVRRGRRGYGRDEAIVWIWL